MIMKGQKGMKKVRTEEAVGKILGADVTEVIPDVKKGPLLKRGHIIQKEDIEKLLSIGKHYIWVFGEDEGFIHEDDAGKKLMELLKGDNLTLGPSSESKVKLFAEIDGILFLNKEGLRDINKLKDSRVACKRHFSFVKRGNPVAIGKVMPIEIPVQEMNEISEVAEKYKPIIEIKPIRPHKIAIFPVGNEFIEGRREETMSFRIKNYLESLGQDVFLRKLLPDNEKIIAEEGKKALAMGADILIYMGGMSVDPDDKTVSGMRSIGGEEIIYGVPVWPGTTFLVSYKGNKIILGIPSSAGFAKSGTSFHRIMPIFLSDYMLSREELLNMADGGFIDAANL
jgi:hypothetical protein